MSDLISRQAVIENIRKYADKKCCNGEIELANGILESLSIIKKQPTAYYVDKVVELMESFADRIEPADENVNTYFMLQEAIEIVKGGGQG